MTARALISQLAESEEWRTLAAKYGAKAATEIRGVKAFKKVMSSSKLDSLVSSLKSAGWEEGFISSGQSFQFGSYPSMSYVTVVPSGTGTYTVYFSNDAIS